ncbi:hypothetical protein [Aureimonas frigidaquae]|uniref:hypothetical protein n=1 Tax=Aureimonas frigidaquae TaxID=424757 RepID=UPI000784F60C|nr:hypothetical protein [Aureimonas frigidaquae]
MQTQNPVGLFFFRHHNIYGALDQRLFYTEDSRRDVEQSVRAHLLDPDAPLIEVKARDGVDINTLLEEVRTPLTTPWAEHQFFMHNYDRWVLHMPTLSVKHPGLVSYYQSEEKRGRNIRTPIKPGRYLKKFFGELLDEETIQSLAIEWETWATPPELNVTQDADEIETVYRDGPHSCMAYSASHFEGCCHPARVYAGPDLAIAYIGPKNDAAGRVVVWPEKKIYSTIYGDIHRTKAALHAAGYKEIENNEEFDGARIRSIYDSRLGCYVVPYLDTHDYAEDAGQYLVLDDSGGIHCRWTNGTNVEDPEPSSDCDECGDNTPDSNLSYVRDHGEFCPHCVETYTFLCDETFNRHHTDERNEGPQEQEYGPDANTFYCDATDTFYLASTRHPHRRTYSSVAMSNGETWVDFHFDAHGYHDAVTGENHPYTSEEERLAA